MKKIIDELINSSIKGVDVYRWKGATWLIFTDEVRWVVELTDEGTLWYNYRFFNDVFRYVSMEVGQQTEEYIIGWANDFFYKDCAHRAAAYPRDKDRTKTSNVLEHGIKEVNQSDSIHRQMRAENVMNKIITEVRPNRVVVPAQGMDRFYYDPGCSANSTDIWMVVEEGVKEIKSSIWTTKRGVEISDLMCSGNTTDISSIVKSGVKNIYPDKDPDVYDWSDEFKADNVIQGGMKVVPLPTKEGLNGYSAYFDSKGWEGKSHTEYVKDAIESGVKVVPLPDPSGELRGYSDYYNTKEDRTKPHTEYVKETIEGGTKL
jgi:hypothetical protein